MMACVQYFLIKGVTLVKINIPGAMLECNHKKWYTLETNRTWEAVENSCAGGYSNRNKTQFKLRVIKITRVKYREG